MLLRKIRVFLATVFFLGITLLLLDVSGGMHSLTGWMAKLQLLPALLALNVVVVVVILLLTLVFGRIYCSTICPLGVWQDLVARMSHRIKTRKKYAYSPALPWLRYGFLAVFVVLIVAGLLGIASLIAPYSSYARMVVQLFQPVWILGNNGLASAAESMDSYVVSSAEYGVWNWSAFVVAIVTLLVVSILAWRGGRTWCNTVCPVGTVLGILSRYSFFKIHFNADKCTGCGQCAHGCKASCIDHKTQHVDASRCVACGNCLTKCKFGALHYALFTRNNTTSGAKTLDAIPDKGRRSFLIGAGFLAGSALAQEGKKVDGGLAEIRNKAVPSREAPLTPPGSRSTRNFAQHCTTCQLCVSECPNHVLRPSTDLSHFLQPTMGYENGFCRPECTRCSEVCPSGAILPISREEKTAVQIGQAKWIEKNCLPVRDGVSCGNCERHCPAGAISMRPLNEADTESPMVPTINPAVCIGCGACEYVCPARPFPAIYVEGYEEHREK